MTSRLRVASDVGGTFTDNLAYDVARETDHRRQGADNPGKPRARHGARVAARVGGAGPERRAMWLMSGTA